MSLTMTDPLTVQRRPIEVEHHQCPPSVIETPFDPRGCIGTQTQFLYRLVSFGTRVFRRHTIELEPVCVGGVGLKLG